MAIEFTWPLIRMRSTSLTKIRPKPECCNGTGNDKPRAVACWERSLVMEAASSTAKVDLRAVKWLFEPADPDSFLRAWRMKSFLHFAGASDRFDHLITWSQLSTLLEQHRMTSPRLVLFKKGQKLDQHLYLEPDSKFRSEYRVRRQMITELQAGATLILNHFDDFNTATQELAQEFEWALRTGVH